jgi:hypothetical protein
MTLTPASNLARKVADLEAEVRRLQRIIQLQKEEIRLINIKRFGPKGEKLSSLQGALLVEEPSVTSQELAQEAQRPQEQKAPPLPRAKQARPNHPGRERLPEHLERREEVIPCCPEDCTCRCIGNAPRWPRLLPRRATKPAQAARPEPRPLPASDIFNRLPGRFFKCLSLPAGGMVK